VNGIFVVDSLMHQFVQPVAARRSMVESIVWTDDESFVALRLRLCHVAKSH
jgi:hypothetical protein